MKVITSINMLTEEMTEMCWHLREEFVEDNFNTNIYVAVYTTANAELRLFEMLDYLCESVCAFDTDSVFYIDDTDNPKDVKLDSLLEKWTLENKATQWVSTGPKRYSMFDINGNSVCCKVKGFTLNYNNSKKINHEAMTKLVLGSLDKVVIIDQGKICRDKSTKEVVNRYQEKVFSFDYDKRRIEYVSDDYVETFLLGFL